MQRIGDILARPLSTLRCSNPRMSLLNARKHRARYVKKLWREYEDEPKKRQPFVDALVHVTMLQQAGYWIQLHANATRWQCSIIADAEIIAVIAEFQGEVRQEWEK